MAMTGTMTTTTMSNHARVRVRVRVPAAAVTAAAGGGGDESLWQERGSLHGSIVVVQNISLIDIWQNQNGNH